MRISGYGYTQEGVIRVPQSRNDIFQTCKPEGEKAGEPKGQGE
jgi:hypothetical protein